MNTDKVEQLAAELGLLLQQKGYKVATAESCTGGGIAYAITSVAGSSNWFEQSLVTYSNESKQHWLGVSYETLALHGAVSEATVTGMAEGLARTTGAELCIAVSGIAGPGGGLPDKPVGMVWLAWNLNGKIDSHCFHFEGDRKEVREFSIEQALVGAISRIQSERS
ncbi:damage-inducible protein CinA [Hahella sp. CCB-MM4]|uniref:CinA family protein n=1 Tax=Hahella sp. (strain CCB-MM4) TaxID=1926491 RepID=UPI000B9ADC90|nr:CinA family protein [Hahella sp. CCB-MM4]OZG70469.1 damage-inducible protein CinA [Hahella sp. CCB-MM4]